jgi:hypothetical protein
VGCIGLIGRQLVGYLLRLLHLLIHRSGLSLSSMMLCLSSLQVMLLLLHLLLQLCYHGLCALQLLLVVGLCPWGGSRSRLHSMLG